MPAKPRVPELTAMVAVVVLHVAVFVLIPARAPRIVSSTSDAAMTLIVIPPVTQPPVVVSKRATPATVRSREKVISVPTMPAEGAPLLTEREPVDFAREATLAAQRGAATIELERRRARGFTPDAQNREPDVVRTPPPEFGWSSTAQRIQALPEGGILVRLSERCVVAVTLMALPACGIGEIPVNGKLFEHMSDRPTLGDWKDDSGPLVPVYGYPDLPMTHAE